MSGSKAWGLAACLLLPLGIGCTHSQGLVRGQSPSAVPVSQAAQPVQPVSNYGLAKTSGAAHSGAYAGSHYATGHCSACGSNNCEQGRCQSCGHCNQSCDWYPTHYHFYHYDVPDEDELVYPPALTPAAVVQYPYYTCKGPDDFFYCH